MAEVQLIKSILMNAAYTGALASIGDINTVDGTPVSPDSLVKDMGLQKKNILVYEEAKIQYAVLVQALQDQTGIWPDPVLPASSSATAQVLAGLGSDALTELAALVKSGASSAQIATALGTLLPKSTTGPTTAPAGGTNPSTPPPSAGIPLKG